MNLSRVDDNPADWDEYTLMRNFINDHPELSVKMMMYQNVRIQLYEAGR
jgi:hypothetical protein